MSGQDFRRSRLAAALSVVLILVVAAGGCSAAPGSTPAGTDHGDDPALDSCGSALAEILAPAGWEIAPPACLAPPPLASGSPWPVGIRDAADAMRSFTGETAAKFSVSGPYPSFGRRVYELVEDGQNADGTFINGQVDADSGRVLFVEYQRRVNGDPGPAAITPVAAIAAADKYLAARHVDVAGLHVSVEKVDYTLEVTFESIQNDVGVLPRVTVQVDRARGTITSIRDEHGTASTPPAPRITSDQAVTLANAKAGLIDPKVEHAQLRVYFGPDGKQILVWALYLSGKQDPDQTDTVYLLLKIDATTGEGPF